ncbi:uncharacterized protein LOC143864181 isoform X2 [Tasmannia lanceolata]
MGGGSEGDEIHLLSNGSNRRFKLHGKALDDCNGVDRAAVPRKLRSAMSKRNCESISPPWPDAKHHCASNGKSKQSMKEGILDRFPKKVVAITKDEEEVAETLFALATMCPYDKPVKRCRVERRRTSSEAPKVETTKLPFISTGTEATGFLLCKEEPVTKPTDSEIPAISESQKFDPQLTSTSQVDLQRTALLSKNEHTQNEQLSDAANLLNPVGVSAESCSVNGSLQPTQPESLQLPNPENVSFPAVPAAPKQEILPIKENKECIAFVAHMEEGPPDLRHGLPSGSCDGHGQLTRSSSAKAAVVRSDSVTCATRPSSTTNGVLTEKLTTMPISVETRQSRKRCIAHVYISHLISDYKSAEKKSRWQTPANQSKLNEDAKFGVTEANKLTGLQNSVDNFFREDTNGLAVERNPHEVRIGILENNRLLQDQQGYDFLSLSAGFESNNSGNGLESPAQLNVPYMHSLAQRHSVMPFLLSHTPYSSPYPDQLVAAQQVQLQIPQYMANPFHGPQLVHSVSAKQQHQQMWAAQTAHYRSGIPSSLLPKWQNGNHDPPSSLPQSTSSLEMLGAKFSPNPQLFYAVSSSREKRQHHPGGENKDVSGVSLAESSGFLKAPGGAPANVAVAVSRLGGNSAFIGKFGDDEFGHMLVDILKENNVNTDGVCFDSDARTALAFVTLKKNGEREFMFYRNPSADMLLEESELNLGLIREAKIFHYGSISLITEPCRSAHIAAMRAAREAGLLLSYDPNLRLPLWPSADAARQGIKSIWNQADFIKISDDEVAFLTNGDPMDEEVVLSLWYEGLKLLVVTDGEKGCRYFTKDFKGKVDGFSVETIDTTGAGDSFVGALLVAIAKDNSLFQDERKLREALTFANACGAICTVQKGAIPALPTTSMALDLIAKSKDH